MKKLVIVNNKVKFVVFPEYIGNENEDKKELADVSDVILKIFGILPTSFSIPTGGSVKAGEAMNWIMKGMHVYTGDFKLTAIAL